MHGATINAYMHTQLCEMTVNIVHELNGLNIMKRLCFEEGNFDDKENKVLMHGNSDKLHHS